ncbi:acid protease [Calocera viscosa TUFC12733]|uniref:Acid protease n=1 Tax=Calocera viscosa (strain TUFC12733) TaxID=1330018 RepID=A0A167L0V7_CALVF|nr:acid protease [Calocera viscosa TUFC12733]
MTDGVQHLITCVAVHNHKYSPNGAASYARSALRWGITHSDNATFFVHNNHLVRRGLFDEHPDAHGAWNIGSHKVTYFSDAGGAMYKKAMTNKNGFISSKAAIPAGISTYSRAFADVPAEDVQNDSEYVVPVTIGNPGVTLNLDFDTGSSDLWVWSSQARGKGNRKIYQPTQSRTAKQAPGLSWNIQYADGSGAQGNVFYDNVMVQGVAVTNQAVETATTLSGAFQTDVQSDGLFGLAFSKINTVTPSKQNTPFQNMLNQKLLDRPIFTVKLDKGDSGGFYTFGHVNGGVLPPGVDIWTTYVDSSNGWWEFESRAIMIGKHEFPRPQGNTAIADTGTTLILLDDDAVSAIYSAVRGAVLNHAAGGWILPSSATVPDLYFACGDRYFGIPGDDLKFSTCSSKGYMFGAVQSRGSNQQDIFGDVFLKRVYALFDARPGTPRIGFGQRDFYST